MKPMLSGQVAIITGGASGIGRATVELFVEEGARVVIADLNEEQGQALADSLGDAIAFKKTDVSRAEDVQALVDFAVTHFGDLHIMFNNAGLSGAVYNSLLDDDFADFQQIMSVNLLGVLLGSQTAARYMKDRGRGVIINTSSIGALKPGMPLLSYRAAKAGVIHASQSIAKELGLYGIRVNCLVPGHIPAGMTFYDMSDTIRRMQPLQRQGSARDAAYTALYLASHMSAQITGAVIPVDGGSHLHGPLNPPRQE